MDTHLRIEAAIAGVFKLGRVERIVSRRCIVADPQARAACRVDHQRVGGTKPFYLKKEERDFLEGGGKHPDIKLNIVPPIKPFFVVLTTHLDFPHPHIPPAGMADSPLTCSYQHHTGRRDTPHDSCKQNPPKTKTERKKKDEPQDYTELLPAMWCCLQT